jgi:CubicO group peptidase (beta-lactamase class C family)
MRDPEQLTLRGIGMRFSEVTMSFPARNHSSFGAALALAMTGLAHGEELGGLKEVRRHMLDTNLVALTFRTMDQIFPTRRVDNAAPAWTLPRKEAALDFQYEYDGKAYAAEEVFDRTYTNALIIVKHGNIIFETYRNQASERTHFASMSVAKSITSILIGLALADGSIRSVNDAITV